MKRAFSLLIAAVAVAMLSGCVAGRRQVDLNVPDLSPIASNGQTVYVAAPVDARYFEEDPREPSTPSIDGDLSEMSAAERTRMIGRQRNTYGGAMGDIALPEDQTVNAKMQQLVQEVFESKGYRVNAASNADYQVDVKIQEFWAWFSPGFWSISFEARLRCEITVSGKGKQFKMIAGGYGLNNGQIASNANWQLAYSRAFQNFIESLQRELTQNGM